jgi:hypothetical protein
MKHKRISLLLLELTLLALLSICPCLVEAFFPRTMSGRWHAAVVYRLPVSSDNVEPQVAASSSEDENDEEEQAFQEQCRALCEERNLPLEKVKNCRDLASVTSPPVIQPVRDSELSGYCSSRDPLYTRYIVN